MTPQDLRDRGMVVIVQDDHAHVTWADADNTTRHDCFVAVVDEELVFHPERSSAQQRLLARLG